ncbi:MAG: hypothetical protein RBS73_02535 [Prolixibacteraceae bacterium]|jgi:uncharacterized protein (DUF3084 family)|nr:hypothetical protein [Prolixibacteraceae bacterium]
MEKKHLQIIGTGIIVVIIGAIFSVYMYTQKEAELKSLMNEQLSLNDQVQQRDSVVNDLMNTFDEIESSLNFVRSKRSQLSVESDPENAKSRKQLIVEDIKLMDTMLEESSRKIAELEKKLKQSGVNMKSFDRRIAALNQNIEEQNSEIAELKRIIEDKDFQIAGLNEKIELMNTDMARQSDTILIKQREIEDKTTELNTGYIAYGTYKELKEKGLLAKEGGILGIGANKTIQENFNDSNFVDIDIRSTQIIPLYAKKATVRSEHPDNSYSLVEEDGQIAYLHIDNPDQFWKISKYAVIEVK